MLQAGDGDKSSQPVGKGAQPRDRRRGGNRLALQHGCVTPGAKSEVTFTSRCFVPASLTALTATDLQGSAGQPAGQAPETL